MRVAPGVGRRQRLVNPHYVISPLQGLRLALEQIAHRLRPGCYLNRRLPLLETGWLLPDAQGRGGYQVQTYDTLDFSRRPARELVYQRSTFPGTKGICRRQPATFFGRTNRAQ